MKPVTKNTFDRFIRNQEYYANYVRTDDHVIMRVYDPHGSVIGTIERDQGETTYRLLEWLTQHPKTLREHGLRYQICKGQLLAIDEFPGGAIKVNITNWTPARLRDWLGY